MIMRRQLQFLRHPFAIVFVAAPLGAFFALLAVKALAVVAGHLGMTAILDILRDAGVNTGPLAAGGGAAAGVGATGGGGSAAQDKRDRKMEEKFKQDERDKEEREKYLKKNPQLVPNDGAPPSAFENATRLVSKAIRTGPAPKY